MGRIFSTRLVWFCLGSAMTGLQSETMMAQSTPNQNLGISVQLPTVQTFGISTAVMVPDGGAIRLGGVNRSAVGRTSNSVPLLGQIPGINRAFRNEAIGADHSASSASVHVRLIINSEIEEDVLAEAERRILARKAVDPNGTPQVQNRAAFLSRNVGRR